MLHDTPKIAKTLIIKYLSRTGQPPCITYGEGVSSLLKIFSSDFFVFHFYRFLVIYLVLPVKHFWIFGFRNATQYFTKCSIMRFFPIFPF